MKDISKDIIAKIKEGHIVPESRLKLRWKSYAFWALMVLMVLIGAVSASLVAFNMIDLDPRLLRYMQLHKFFRVIVFTAPYFWIGLSLLALVFGVLAFHKTSRGYRKSLIFVTSLVVLAVSILGVAGHMMKINKMMDGMIRRNAPAGFREISGMREGHWTRPGDGLIGGEIISIGEREFFLRSFKDDEWRIIFDEKTEREVAQEIVVGDKIGVIGERVGDFVMQAFSIRKFPSDWDGLPPRRMAPSDNGDKNFPNDRLVPFLPEGSLREN
jgi:hypothetical protein